MKRILLIIAIASMAALLLMPGALVEAAKPMDVIERSNGYPSGAHFNLNIHGKKETYVCDMSSGGRSVFILEYGLSTIQFLSNRKSSVTELTVLDKCAEAFDGDPALVQIPAEAEGYYVFGAIKGKPNNGANSGDPSSVILVPDPILEVCNDDPDNPDPTFPDATSCDDTLWALGLVTTSGVYEATDAEFVRFDSGSGSKGKGKSKAVDITGLFLWSGYVCDAVLDTNGPDGVPDGVIDLFDAPIEYDLIANGGNGNGFIDQFEFENWLADEEALGTCTFYDNEWVFNVADLVVQDQEIQNDGTKLLKIRFYPVSTTEFTR